MTKRRAIWRPLTKPELAPSLYTRELGTLRDYWARVRQLCKGEPRFERHTQELLRRTVIETGQIEGVYALDRGTTETLVRQGFEASLIGHGGAGPVSAEQAVDILRDQEEAYRQIMTAVSGGMDLIGGTRTFGESVVKDLHAVLTRSQEFAEGRDLLGNRVRVPLLRGAYKRLPSIPTRSDGIVEEYCPPEQVAPQMEALFRIFAELEREGADPIPLAAWFHHAFTIIHPFQDGNGRLVRLLASVILIKNGMLYLSIDRGEQREEYLAALRRCDAGDLAPFVDLIARQQKLALLNAVMVGAPEAPSSELETEDPVERAIERLRFATVGSDEDESWNGRVTAYFEPLARALVQRGNSLQSSLDPTKKRISVTTFEHRRGRRHEWKTGRRIMPTFDLRPRSAVPSYLMSVAVADAPAEGAWFWCVEPNCVARGLILAFVEVQGERDSDRLFAQGLLPLVGDLDAGPEQLATQWAELVDATVVHMLDSLAADH